MENGSISNPRAWAISCGERPCVWAVLRTVDCAQKSSLSTTTRCPAFPPSARATRTASCTRLPGGRGAFQSRVGSPSTGPSKSALTNRLAVVSTMVRVDVLLIGDSPVDLEIQQIDSGAQHHRFHGTLSIVAGAAAIDVIEIGPYDARADGQTVGCRDLPYHRVRGKR